MKKLYQKGLSLLELMTALALGLVLVAVAVQMFISSQANLALQRSLGDLQDNGLFGLDFIAKDLRKINLGASLAVLDSQIAQGGIILSNNNIIGSGNIHLNGFNAAYLSHTAQLANTSNFKDLNSDQLTIQYKTVQNIYDDATFLRKMNNNSLSEGERDTVVGYDCEGGKIVLNDVVNQVYIIQRYYVRTSNTGSLGLYCDAGRYAWGELETAWANSEKDEAGTQKHVVNISSLDAGQLVIPRVDHFRVLLGVAEGQYNESNKFRYISFEDYEKLPQDNLPTIRSVKLALVIRSQDPISKSSNKLTDTFDILDKTQQTLIGGQDHYMRQVLTQTIALRNALGEDLRPPKEQQAAPGETTP